MSVFPSINFSISSCKQLQWLKVFCWNLLEGANCGYADRLSNLSNISATKWDSMTSRGAQSWWRLGSNNGRRIQGHRSTCGDHAWHFERTSQQIWTLNFIFTRVTYLWKLGNPYTIETSSGKAKFKIMTGLYNRVNNYDILGESYRDVITCISHVIETLIGTSVYHGNIVFATIMSVT